LSSQGYKTIGITNNSFISPEFGFTGWDEHICINDYEKYINYPTIQQIFKSGENSTFTQLKSLLYGVVERGDFRSFRKAASLKFKDYPLSPFPDAGAKAAIAKAKSQMQQATQPFFLYLNFMETHMPYDPPNKIAAEFVSDPIKKKQKMVDGYHIGRNRKSFRWEEKSNETIEAARGLYDSTIRYLDSQLRLLYEWIQTNKQNTIFIIISDHGELIGEHEMYGHQCGIWEKLLRVPIIIYGPQIQSRVEYKNVALRDSYGFLTNGLDTNELGKTQVFAEYYGYEKLLRNEEFDINQYEEHEYKYLRNRAKAVINGKTGVVIQSHLENQTFRASDSSNNDEISSSCVRSQYEDIVEEFSIVDMSELSL
jgi:phosphoglycerol transferase MdoB-like AlkP superfamily enzyme